MIYYVKAFLIVLGVLGLVLVVSLLVDWLAPSWMVGLALLGWMIWCTRAIAGDMKKEAAMRKRAQR
jgi:hypothetical protein